MLAVMEHARQVVAAIDNYLYECHGQNAEFEAELYAMWRSE